MKYKHNKTNYIQAYIYHLAPCKNIIDNISNPICSSDMWQLDGLHIASLKSQVSLQCQSRREAEPDRRTKSGLHTTEGGRLPRAPQSLELDAKQPLHKGRIFICDE